MINRIKEIARFYGLSSTAFADQVEIPRPVISHIFSERNRPSLEVIQKIGTAFPDVHLDWLLYGKGEMLKKAASLAGVQSENIPDKIIQTIENEILEVKKEESKSPKVEAELKPAVLKKTGSKKTVKIVFIYDDNSFEEFKP